MQEKGSQVSNEVIGNFADGINAAWYGSEAAYYAAQGDCEKAREATLNAAFTAIGFVPFGNLLGKGGKWVGNTPVGRWGSQALQGAGNTRLGRRASEGLGWAAQQGGRAADWMSTQGASALELAGRQRENFLRPFSNLANGRNLDAVAPPRGAMPTPGSRVPDVEAPTTASPRSQVEAHRRGSVEPESPAPRNAEQTGLRTPDNPAARRLAEDPNGIEALAEAAPNPESARRFREQGNDVIDRYGREEGIEMLQEGTLAKRATSDGHTLKVLSDGKIVRCSTCGEFYDKYQDILDDPDYQPLRQKFKELEAKAQADPESVIDEIDDLDRLLREARQTKPSRQPDVGATPTGRPARIRPNESPENIRALQQENDSAIVLAQKGYQVEQNPRIPETSRNPDYRIEGRVFDNYAPTTRNVRSIWTIVQEKVTSGQTERIILNLNDNNLSLNALEKQFSEWEIPGLKEVIIVQNGNVIPFWP